MLRYERRLCVREDELEWETWKDPSLKDRSPIIWKTLISQDKTDSSRLVAGVAEIPEGTLLIRHSHAEEEVYYILEGEGHLELDDETIRVTRGTSVFIPGNVEHALTNTGIRTLKLLYMFPTDSFEDIEYTFPMKESLE